MKKITTLLFIFASLALSAQDARQRTTTTIVQDVLAAMPASSSADLAADMRDFASVAPESVVIAAGMMKDPVEGVNSPMEYALNAVANYATVSDKATRKNVVKGFKEAIASAGNPYVKAFLQTQLRLIVPSTYKKAYMDTYQSAVSEEAEKAYKMEQAIASEVFVLSEQETKEGYTILFDGTNLNQWQGNKEGYIVDNGTIKVTAKYGNESNLYTVKEYKDFVLRFEFLFEKPGVNNGVGIRTPMGVDAAYQGMCECQVLDHDAPIYKGLQPYQVHGSAYGIIPAKRIVHKPIGEWSTEEIIVKGDHIKVTVNGEVILDGDLREACQGHNVAPEGETGNPYTVDHKNHPGMFNEKGFISFCGHGEGLRYRYVRVKEL